MPEFVQGTVVEILETRRGLQKVRVARADGGDGDLAYALTDVIGATTVDDVVVLNVTAVELALGTGGWHVIHWNLSRDSFSAPGPGHIMKARYSSVQIDSGAAEETAASARSLNGLPVVACMLTSQAAVAVLAYKRERPTARIAILVTDQASLPVAFSDLLASLGERGVVDVVMSSGQAFGGDREAVNVASGLCMLAAENYDVVFVTEGPGVVGTGSTFGYSGFEMAGIVDLVHKLGGEPYVAVRYSDADSRERHRGVSHHTRTVLAHCEKATIAVPQGSPLIGTRSHFCVSVDVGDVESMLDGWNITSMRRSHRDDPSFFSYAAAAGIAAARQNSSGSDPGHTAQPSLPK